MKLYQSDWSPYPRRVLIYLAEKGIDDIDRVFVDLMERENHQPKILTLNPSGKIPILVVTPEVVIRQSTSILEYLEEKYPQPDMIGSTPEARAMTRDLMYMVNDYFLLLSYYFSQRSPLFATTFEQKPDAATAFYAAYQRSIREIEQTIGDDEFLCGKRPTIADCMMFASAQYADRVYGEPLPEDCPKLQAFYVNFEQRPSVAVPEYPELLLRLAPLPR